MKKIYFLLFSSIMIVNANSTMIDKINQTLEQISFEANQKQKINLDVKYDPFFHDRKFTTSRSKQSTTSKTTTTEKKSLVLSMILNKKAFINGIWYKENQKVAQYMLNKVNQDSVVLKRKHKTIVLKLKTADKLLVKKEAI